MIKMYFNSNEIFEPSNFTFDQRRSLYAVAGGSDIPLILAGLHNVDYVKVIDREPMQLDLFRSKLECIKKDDVGMAFSSIFFNPYYSISEKSLEGIIEENKDFLLNNSSSILASKQFLYDFFLSDYSRFFDLNENGWVYENLKTLKVDYDLSDAYEGVDSSFDTIYFSNVIDHVNEDSYDLVLSDLNKISKEAIIYDSSLCLTEKNFPEIKRYSKEEYIKKIEYIKLL